MLIGTIRDRVSGWIVWVIVGLICITFALFGIQEYLEGLNRVVVAKVNGEEIDYDTYQQALNNRRANMARTFGNRIDQSIFSSAEFKTQTVESMVSDRLIAADVEESGYRISDTQLGNLIQNFPAFKDTDGNFNKELYTATLRRQGLSPQAFEQIQRQQNAIDQIRNGFVSSAFVTEKEMSRMVALTEEERDTDVALIPFSKFDESVEVSEDEARAEFDENQEAYRAPARAKFQYVELSVDKLMAGVSVNEEDVKVAYDSNRTQYVDEERRKARHILVKLAQDADADTDKDAFEKAKGLLEKAKAGEDFSELAKENSEDTGSAASGGDLGLVTRGVMVKPFEDALFAMDAGAVSDEPVRSRFGYHIIKLEEIEAERIKPFEDVREELEEQERRSRAVDLYTELSENFRNVVFEQPDQLDAAAAEIDGEVQSTDWIDRDRGVGLFSTPQVRDVAFGEEVIQEELNSPAIEVGADTLLAVRKLEYEESRIRDFEDAKASAETNVKRRKTEEAAAALGEELLGKLNSGGTWEEVLAEAEIVPTEGPTKRNQPGTTPVNRALVESVFSADVPEEGKATYGGESVLNSNYAIYRVSSSKVGNVDVVEEATRNQITQRLQRRLGDEVFLAYQTGLRDGADVVLLDDNIQDDTLGSNYGSN